MFWLAVEVFRNRNWKAAKFFGMDMDPLPISKAPMPTPTVPTPSKKAEIERRKSRKEKIREQSSDAKAAQALKLQRQLDMSAASRMGVNLEQLYLIKEADFIFDNFIKRDGAYWTCVDADSAREIEEKLMDPVNLRRDVFEKAQTQAFNGMNDDLMPRFIKEVIAASKQDPVSPEMREVCQRYDELKQVPNRRKTGVSTALAFVFRRRTSNDRESKVQTVSSREQGLFNGKPATGSAGGGKSVDATKATTLLRQRSHLTLLGPEGGSVGALALSRSRLSSHGGSDLANALAESKKSNLGTKKSGLRKIERDLKKRSSAPVSQADIDRESLTRRMEIGIQRSRSDGALLSRGAHIRAREFGIDTGTQNSRSTVSKLNVSSPGEALVIGFEGAARKNSV